MYLLFFYSLHIEKTTKFVNQHFYWIWMMTLLPWRRCQEVWWCRHPVSARDWPGPGNAEISLAASLTPPACTDTRSLPWSRWLACDWQTRRITASPLAIIVCLRPSYKGGGCWHIRRKSLYTALVHAFLHPLTPRLPFMTFIEIMETLYLYIDISVGQNLKSCHLNAV